MEGGRECIPYSELLLHWHVCTVLYSDGLIVVHRMIGCTRGAPYWSSVGMRSSLPRDRDSWELKYTFSMNKIKRVIHWDANTCPSQLLHFPRGFRRRGRVPTQKWKDKRWRERDAPLRCPTDEGWWGPHLSFLLLSCYYGFHSLWSCSLLRHASCVNFQKWDSVTWAPQDQLFLLLTRHQ